MSFSDDTRSLTQSFQHTHDLLERLLAALNARRAAWVSARPSTLAPSPELEQLTQAIAREETLRDDLLARIRVALPAPFGHAASVSHVNVTRIAAALPAAESQALRDVAAVVQRLAKAVRAEVTLGQRLVRFAQVAAVAPLAAPPGGAPHYDRDARMVRAGKLAGAIVDGKV
jgi:hypothetical protein